MDKNILFWNPWWRGRKFEVNDRYIYDIGLLDRKEAVFFSGVRRSGKTYYMYYLINHLLKTTDAPNILFLNMDDEVLQFEKLSDIYEKYLELYPSTKGRKYIFLDEIQNINGWERWVKNMYDSGQDVKFFITGSNAGVLHRESSSLLTGRLIRRNVYPLNFKELLFLNNINFDRKSIAENEPMIKNLFRKHMKFGGFPQVVFEKDGMQKILLLKNYFENIRDKDIIASFNIKQAAKFERLAHYLISNISRPFSAKKIGSTIRLSTTVVNQYLDYAEQVYWFLQLKNFSFSLKAQITSKRKIYCIDTGFVHSTAFAFSENLGRILENEVFLHLAGREVYYHKQKHECDFVVKERNKVVDAIQVTTKLDEHNRKRELDGLLEAMQNHNLNTGLVLTLEQEDEMIIGGKKVTIMPVWRWILEKA